MCKTFACFVNKKLQGTFNSNTLKSILKTCNWYCQHNCSFNKHTENTAPDLYLLWYKNIFSSPITEMFCRRMFKVFWFQVKKKVHWLDQTSSWINFSFRQTLHIYCRCEVCMHLCLGMIRMKFWVVKISWCGRSQLGCVRQYRKTAWNKEKADVKKTLTKCQLTPVSFVVVVVVSAHHSVHHLFLLLCFHFMDAGYLCLGLDAISM